MTELGGVRYLDLTTTSIEDLTSLKPVSIPAVDPGPVSSSFNVLSVEAPYEERSPDSPPTLGERFITGLKKYPAHAAEGIYNLVTTPGRAWNEGISEQEATAFGANVALATIGTGTKFPAKVPRGEVTVRPYREETPPDTYSPYYDVQINQVEANKHVIQAINTKTKEISDIGSIYEVAAPGGSRYVYILGSDATGFMSNPIKSLERAFVDVKTEIGDYFIDVGKTPEHFIKDYENASKALKPVPFKLPPAVPPKSEWGGVGKDVPAEVFDFHEPTLKHKPTKTDLPLDQGERIQRAKQLEYNVENTGDIGGDWYHGSPYDILEGFDLSKSKSETAVFLSKQPNIADIYGSNIYPVWTRAKNIEVVDMEQKSYSHATFAREINKAREEGKDAVLFKNVSDVGGLQDQLAILKPDMIRSKFARFDPILKNSANLAAGGAGTAILLRRPAKEE